MENGIMLQAFEWELPPDGTLWCQVERDAFRLRRMGITAAWLPPAYKGCGGEKDVGYGVYDLYDLGEFNQKGSVRTKYGTKVEYLRALNALHAAGVQALPDVVLNHRMGGDGLETARVYCEGMDCRCRDDAPQKDISLYSRFTFPGRKGKYSDFVWDASCFTGTDWDDAAKQGGLYRMVGKRWAEDVDREHGNYDYLMGLDVDMQSEKVRGELQRWGRWYSDTTHCDGFRLDAVKHISASFYRNWLCKLRAETGKELFAVGEYWQADVAALNAYLDQVQECMSLFDVPLHFHLRDAACSAGYDMSHLFDGTLVGCRPHVAVTFVDNHDTQPGQSLESWVPDWFKPAAYGLILLRAYGYPCVFYGDLVGIPAKGLDAVASLPGLMNLRRTGAYGLERDYFDHPNIIGFTRAGDASHPGSGLAFLCSNGPGGAKRMELGPAMAGRKLVCVLGEGEDVTADATGAALFDIGERATCIWVPELTRQERAASMLRSGAELAGEAARRIAWRFRRGKER